VAQVEAHQCIVLDWQEHVPEGIEAPGLGGFGTRVVQAAVSSELDGHTDLAYGPDGLRCRFTFTTSAT